MRPTTPRPAREAPASDATGPMLNVAGATKAFRGMSTPALEDVGFTLRRGEFTSLLGPSGCGKTTLLRSVAGLLELDSGTIEIAGQTSTGPSTDKAFVFQHFSLFPWRTVLDNAAYGLELQGMSKKDRYARAGEYLDLLRLSDFAGHYPAQISGGMQQRVGIARALALDPRVLLMDEPFGALDALTRERLQNELETICSTGDLTVLFVTHAIDEAIMLSDSIVVMGIRPGRVLKRFEVTFPRPRSSTEFRADPAYVRMRREIWSLLEDELNRGTDH